MHTLQSTLRTFLPVAISCSVVSPCIRSQVAGQEVAVLGGTISGQITDPSKALIPGASVSLVTTAGAPKATATSTGAGEFSFRDLKPGSYRIQVNAEGFSPFKSSPILVTANQSKRIVVAMAIPGADVSVVVTTEDAQVNTEAGNNASAVVLKGNDLDALADDPDELANELSALAGPSAGPNGAQIYIDGFSGGELPPKSAILEIRVNQNPFSAEFDRLGYGRIEILTKPGTEKLHGQALLQGNDKPFNTGNPFTSSVPAYHSIQFSGALSGALSKSASFALNVDSRDIQSVNAWIIPNAVLPNSAGVFVDNFNYSVSLLSPHIRDNVSARFDWQLGRTTMTARYGFWYENEKGNLDTGPGTLQSASVHESNSDHTVQLASTTVINDHFVNESRFQFERHDENHYADSNRRTISVSGDFLGGGASSQASQDHRLALEFQNLSTLSYKQHAIAFGARLRDNRDANKSTANFNGTFSFAPNTIGNTTYEASQVYKQLANGLATGQSFNSLVRQGFGPSAASYTAGNPSAVANVFDGAVFFQDDFRFRPRLTLSAGLRFETQNHIADHYDFAPRIAAAYALDGRNNQKTKTVLRAGIGFFYDRLSMQNLFNVNRYNKVTQVVLTNPICNTSAASLDAIDMATCFSSTGAVTSAPVRYQIAPHYHAPYTEQAAISLERQLLPSTSVTVTYLHSFGVHQQVLRNANQAPGGTAGTASSSYLYQYFSQAVFKQHQVTISAKTRLTKTLSLSGFYTYSSAVSNGAGSTASNAFHLDQDLGRAGFVLPHLGFVTGTWNAPWGISVNPFIVAQAGRPFNVTLAADPLNNLFNQRPTYATAATPPINRVDTPYGTLNSAPIPGEQIVPINLGTAPSAFAVNLRVSRGFSFGGKARPGAARTGGGEEAFSGTNAPSTNVGRGAPGGGSLGSGGLGGNTGASSNGSVPVTAGRKYALRFSVQALNVFNNINKGTPTGVLTSPYFNRPTSLVGGAYSTGSAARRVYLQTSFSF